MGAWTKWRSRSGFAWIIQYHVGGKQPPYSGCKSLVGYRGGPRWQHVLAPRRRGPFTLDRAIEILHNEKTSQQERMNDLGKPMNVTYRLYNIETKDIVLGDIL
jgi:hypothetical protein